MLLDLRFKKLLKFFMAFRGYNFPSDDKLRVWRTKNQHTTSNFAYSNYPTLYLQLCELQTTCV